MDVDKLIEKFALANAFSHDGKAQAGAVIGKLIGEDPKYKLQLKQLMPKINKIISEVNKLKFAVQGEKLKKIWPDFFKPKEVKEKELSELPGAVDGKVVMRLAPFPSGALHLGNAKTYVLNALYAEKYHGKIILVIDDTIGSEEKAIIPEAYDLIPDGFRWLGIRWDGPILYKSDRLDIYYKYAKELIQKGFAYVCECPSEVLRENRAKGKDCIHRKQTVKETLAKWEAMQKGKYKEGQAILRLKTTMQHPNPAFRDRVLFRISERKHPRVGDKYKVWPMLEFSWAIDDHLLGTTHVFRGKDLMMESEMCKFIWDIFKWPFPTLIHTGLVRIEGIKMSKSKAQAEVKSGKFSGWDDPRTWSLQSLKRRGFRPEAIIELIRSIGPNQTDITIPIDNLYIMNKKILEPITDRYYFIEDPAKIEVKDAPKIQSVNVRLHPGKDETRTVKVSPILYIPQRDIKISKNLEIRLMHLYNIKDSKYTSTEVKDIPKVQWVADNFKIDAEVLMPDGKVVKGFAEKNVAKLKVGDVIQFERFGFVRLDEKSKDKISFVFAHN